MSKGYKFIEGFDEQYAICKNGDVLSFKRGVTRKLKPQKHPQGYYFIMLWQRQYGYRAFLIHRLVAQYYLLNTENYPVVNHINGIKTDNRSTNLEWCTVLHNNNHGYKIGTHKAVRHKLTDSQILEIKHLLTLPKKNLCKIGRQFNVSDCTIRQIMTNQTHKNII
jgi:hypothetical protein